MEATSLVVFDFDGTLSRGPTICEVLAESLSKLPRIKEIELLETREELAAAREEMAPWWDSMSEADIAKSLQGVNLAPGRKEAFSLFREHGVVIAIASITCRFAIEHFAKAWGIEHYIGTSTSETGEIEHVWAEQKAEFLQRLSSELGLPQSRIAVIGDSSGDFDMLKVAGEPVFVGTGIEQCVESWKHMPNANISEIAEYLIERWQLKPNQNL
ncbi:MAG: HAD-IB family phosphatase [Gammaproteobacteria bacterium]|nr:HAD-IB family phosphatase [Gammaproteobacteria bacterium]